RTPPPPPRTPPPPPRTPPPPPPRGRCPRNGLPLQICSTILSIFDGFLGFGRAQPCCSLIRNLSDADALACLCESVRAPSGSLPPNIINLYRTCGRSIPPGFTCP
ncbi:unnamed protein product, partial [Arabidopsis lyrata]